MGTTRHSGCVLDRCGQEKQDFSCQSDECQICFCITDLQKLVQLFEVVALLQPMDGMHQVEVRRSHRRPARWMALQ